MKEFEKWDKRVKVKTWSGNIQERQERKWYREQTWKAALEWVLSQSETFWDGNDFSAIPEDGIRQELEG